MTTWTIRLIGRKFHAPAQGSARVEATFLNVARGVADQASAVPVGDVQVEQRALTTAEVERGLVDGSIRSTDLVHVDGQWVSLADSMPFADAAVAPARREARARFLMGALLFAALVALMALRFWIGMLRARASV